MHKISEPSLEYIYSMTEWKIVILDMHYGLVEGCYPPWKKVDILYWKVALTDAGTLDCLLLAFGGILNYEIPGGWDDAAA